MTISRHFHRNWVILAVLFGELLRLVQYLWRQAFWGDEVAVLVNLVHYPPSRLPFTRLDAYPAHVAAPPLFLLATQWMGDHWHYSEYAVRLLPLLCSMAALPLFAVLAWRMSAPAAGWGVTFLALSDALIFQAANAKPYSGDVLISTLLLMLSVSDNRPPQRRLLGVVLLATLAFWFSYSTIFPFVACVLALSIELYRRNPKQLLWVGVCVIAAASFLAVRRLSIQVQRDEKLDSMWVHAFPDFSHPLSIPGWMVGSTMEIFYDQFYPIGQLLLIAALIGVWTLRRPAQRTMLILLTGPIILNVFASFAQQYPFAGTRFSLFMCPSLCLLCGMGCAAAFGWLRAILAIAPISAAAVAMYGLFVPQNKGDLRDAVQFVQAHRRPGERVYLSGGQTKGALEWYLPNMDALTRMWPLESPIPGANYWLVLCYVPRNMEDVRAAMTQHDAVIDESRSFHTNGAMVLFFVPRGDHP